MSDNRGLCLLGSSAVQVLENAANHIRQWAEGQQMPLNAVGVEINNVMTLLGAQLETHSKYDYCGFCEEDLCADNFRILYREPILRLVSSR